MPSTYAKKDQLQKPVKNGGKTHSRVVGNRKIPRVGKKQRGTKQVKHSAWVAFSRWIRLRDCIRTTNSITHGVCCTCKKIFPFKELQAGHFLGGRHNANLFAPTGVHAQCAGCNKYLHGNQVMYFYFMEEMYGREEITRLVEQNKLIKKITRIELEDIRATYSMLANELESEYGNR